MQRPFLLANLFVQGRIIAIMDGAVTKEANIQMFGNSSCIVCVRLFWLF